MQKISMLINLPSGDGKKTINFPVSCLANVHLMCLELDFHYSPYVIFGRTLNAVKFTVPHFKNIKIIFVIHRLDLSLLISVPSIIVFTLEHSTEILKTHFL